MKIAVVVSEMSASIGGGYTFQQEIVQEILKGAHQGRHEFVFVLPCGSALINEDQVSGGAQNILRYSINPFARILAKKLKWLNQLQDDFLGKRLISFSMPIVRALRARGVEFVWHVSPTYWDMDLPFLFTVLDLQHWEQPWFPEVSARGEWHRRVSHYSEALQRAAGIIVPNEWGKEQVLRSFAACRERIVVNPHPTPTFALQQASTPKGGRESLDQLKISDDYIFYPAQYWAHKNHAVILEALALLQSKNKPIPDLVCVGSDKGNLAHLKSYAQKLGLEKKVHFFGFVETKLLITLYQHARALVYASFFGPENLPPLEAFALGCPVIAADVPGAQEQMKGAALLFPPTEAQKLVEALELILGERTREDTLQKGKKRASEWTCSHYVHRCLEFFDHFSLVRRAWGIDL